MEPLFPKALSQNFFFGADVVTVANTVRLKPTSFTQLSACKAIPECSLSKLNVRHNTYVC